MPLRILGGGRRSRAAWTSLFLGLIVLGALGVAAPQPDRFLSASDTPTDTHAVTEQAYVAAGDGLLAYGTAAFRSFGIPEFQLTRVSADTPGGRATKNAGNAGNAAPGRPANPQHLLYIASVAKTFTATAVMQLVDQDLLALDTTVGEVLFATPVAESGPIGGITVRQLLSHTSGLSANDGLRYMSKQLRASDYSVLRTLEPANRPGSAHQYSNLNYKILGLMVERITGSCLSEYLHGAVFAPLELTETYTTETVPALQADAVMPGYTHVATVPVAVRWARGFADVPSGGIISTHRDLERYARYLLSQNAEGRPEMWTPVRLTTGENAGRSSGWGLGWEIKDLGERYVVTHDGDLPGYHANITIAPGTGEAVVITANADTLLLALATEFVQENLQRALVGAEPIVTPNYRMVVLGIIGLLLVFLLSDLVAVVRIDEYAQRRIAGRTGRLKRWFGGRLDRQGSHRPAPETDRRRGVITARRGALPVMLPVILPGLIPTVVLIIGAVWLVASGLLLSAFTMQPDVIAIIALGVLASAAKAGRLIWWMRRNPAGSTDH